MAESLRPQRKAIRLREYNYNTPGFYFITICTKEKRKLLCDIVGTGVLDGPQVQLTRYGRTADKQILFMSDFYSDLKVDKYVIMPNHVHLLIQIECESVEFPEKKDATNSKISQFVGTFKRFCNREYGENIWQARSYDHVIRGEKDYMEIWEYIDSNPAKWSQDRFFVE